MGVKRFVSVYLPWWSVERVRRLSARREGVPGADGGARAGAMRAWPARADGRGILLITVVHGIERVVRCCPVGAKAGVRTGMTLAHGQSLLGGWRTLVERHQPGREAGALDRLARAATRFSPVVAPDWPDGLLLDITGCERVFKGEHRLLSQLARWLMGQGFTVRLGMAPTAGGAWALARYGARPRRDGTNRRWPWASQETLVEALAGLPVEALRLSGESVLKLRTVGVRVVHEVLAMEKPGLLERLGEKEVLRINQALGFSQELLTAHRPDEPVVFERVFDGPCTQIQAVEMSLRMLVEEACAWLLSREAGVSRLRVTVVCSDLPEFKREAAFSRATRDARHIWAVLYPSIERVHLGWGALWVGLEVVGHCRLTHRQVETWGLVDGREGGREMDESVGALVDQWVGRLGPGCVLRPVLALTHSPERKVGLVGGVAGKVARGVMGRAGGYPTLGVPGVVFDPAEEVIVDLPADDESAPPTCVYWRGQRLEITQGSGPERVTGEWWRASVRGLAGTRDYHRLRDGLGRWLWVFEERETSRWFIHGVWA